MEPYVLVPNERISRSKTSEKLIVDGFSDLTKSSYKNDAIRLWNDCPDSVTMCNSIYTA